MLAQAVAAVGDAEELSVSAHGDSGVTVRSQHPGFSNALALKVVQSSLSLPPQEFDKFIIGEFGSGAAAGDAKVKREQGIPLPAVQLAVPVKPVWAFLQLVQAPPVASDCVSLYFHRAQVPALLSTDQSAGRPYYADMVLATVDSMSEDVPPPVAAAAAAVVGGREGPAAAAPPPSQAPGAGGHSPDGGQSRGGPLSQTAPIRSIPPPQSQPGPPSQGLSGGGGGAEDTLRLPGSSASVSLLHSSAAHGATVVDGEGPLIAGVSPIRRSRGASSAPVGGAGGQQRDRLHADPLSTGAHSAVLERHQAGGASYAALSTGGGSALGGVSQSPTQDSPSLF